MKSPVAKPASLQSNVLPIQVFSTLWNVKCDKGDPELLSSFEIVHETRMGKYSTLSYSSLTPLFPDW